MFENRGLRRIFGSDRDEVIGGWRKYYNKEGHKLYSFLIIIRMIKSRKMSRMGYIACLWKECVQRFFGKTRRKETLGNK
jgi:hypothetical protein